MARAKLKLNAAMKGVPPFALHDLRRVVRSNMAAMRIDPDIAEAVLGHSKRGMEKVYNQHRFEAETKEALEAWAARLRSILDPGSNVIRPQRFASRDQ